MAEGQTGQEPSRAAMHARLQNRVAWTFLVAAGAVGVWMFVGPHPDNRVVMLAFVQLPLFVVLALIGVNALVRRGMGPKRGRR